MPEIILQGSPYQRGLKHGETFAKEIRRAYDTICKPIKEKWNCKKEGTLYKLFKNLQSTFPDLIEEIEGISRGSKMNFEDILLLNFYHGLGVIKLQCTNLAFVNGEQGAIHGKTGDAEDCSSPFYLLEVVNPDKDPSFINFCYVGTVWTEAGVNSIGLSCGQSSSSTISGQDGRGIPCLVMPRPLLQKCSTVEEGIEF